MTHKGTCDTIRDVYLTEPSNYENSQGKTPISLTPSLSIY